MKWLLVTIAILVAFGGASLPAQSETYTRIGVWSAPMLPGALSGPERIAYVAQDCPGSYLGYAVNIHDVEEHLGSTLEFRFESADVVIDAALLHVEVYDDCEAVAFGSPCASGGAASSRQKVALCGRYVAVTSGGLATGARYSIHRCTSEAC